MVRRGANGEEFVINPPPPLAYGLKTKLAVRDLYLHFYWRVMVGPRVLVKWPTGTEPNEAYRPWLEENVGKQGKDWEWNHVYVEAGAFDLEIVLTKKKKHHAAMIALMWQ